MKPKRTIKAVERDLQSALYILRDHFKRDWANECFENLKFLISLAKKAKAK